MSTRRQAQKEFARLVKESGDELPLDWAVTWIAVDEEPELDPKDPIKGLDELAASIHIPATTQIFEKIARINYHLFDQLDFRGDERKYDEPHNSLIHRVLQRRRGLPILLSLIYIEVARRLDVRIDGIGFPGHFLVSPHDVEPRFFIDPFRKGAILREDFLRMRMRQIFAPKQMRTDQEERMLKPVNNRQLMVRVNNNLKGSYMKRNNLYAALRAVDRLILLEPEWVEQIRDRGLILIGLDRQDEGIRELRNYLNANPAAADADHIRKRMAELASAE